MKKKIVGLYVRLIYAKRSIKAINQPKIGDVVTYMGQQCRLIQGVNNPYWNLLPLNEENLAKSRRDIIEYVHRTDFKLQPFYKRALWAFKSRYSFFMTYWYTIDVNKRLHLL